MTEQTATVDGLMELVEDYGGARAETALCNARAWPNGENMRYMYSDQPGCNCLHDNKPHPVIHAESCPYRIRYSAAYGMKEPAP